MLEEDINRNKNLKTYYLCKFTVQNCIKPIFYICRDSYFGRQKIEVQNPITKVF